MKLKLEDGVLEADPKRLLELIEEVREAATNITDRAILVGPGGVKTDTLLQEMMHKGYIALTRLRGIHRQVHHEVEQRKQQTSKFSESEQTETMQRLKSTEYGLNSFREIVQHYPTLSDAIGLISEADFAKIYQPTRPEDSQEHKLTLTRLKHEEEQRRNLAGKLREIPLKQGALKSSLTSETRELDAMKQKIRDFGAEIKQFKNTMKVPDPTLQQCDSRASLLPQPLYNLFVQLTSYTSVFGGQDMEVLISGSAGSVKNLSSSKQKSEGESSSSQTPFGTYKPRSMLTAGQAQQTHPLSIKVDLAATPAGLAHKTGFLFEYFVNLNIVAVTPSDDDPRILAALVDGDFGETSPNWATELITAPGTQILPKRARAYKWLQALCGLHFPPAPQRTNPNEPTAATPDLAPFAASLTDTIELLKKRIHTRYVLTQIHAILALARIEVEMVRPPVPATAVLRKWAEQSAAQAATALNEASTLYKKHRLSTSHLVAAPSPHSFFHLATFGAPGHANTAQLLVELPPQYPAIPATFYIIGINDIAGSDLALLTQTLQSHKQDISSDQAFLYILAWFRDCLNVHLDICNLGSNSRFFENPKRFDTNSWAISS